MRLLVRYPSGYPAERLYAIDILLGTLLKLRYQAEPHTEDVTEISVPATDSRRLIVSDGLFTMPDSLWLTKSSLPREPLKRWLVAQDLPELSGWIDELPVIYSGSDCSQWLETREDGLRLHLDLFGSSFFMLSRYEETVLDARDTHGRFPAAASLAWKEGFLLRPIVDEYARVLLACLMRLWPGIETPRRNPRVLVSHDVDWPLLPKAGFLRTVRHSLGDVVRRGAMSTAIRRWHAFYGARRGDFRYDPYNTFDFLMDAAEARGLRSAFFLIAGHSAGPIDGEYSLADSWIQDLMRRIAARGHEIGYHGSYNSYDDPAIIAHEFDSLRRAVERLGIKQDQWGGRQHYLRWKAPTTWRAWAGAGLSYDSSVGYADHVGFRSGTCFEYEVFDLESRSRLPIKERPLVVMEVSLLGKQYMNLRHDQAVRVGLQLRETCEKFGGDFTLLWHNSNLLTAQDKAAFLALITR